MVSFIEVPKIFTFVQINFMIILPLLQRKRGCLTSKRSSLSFICQA